MHGLRVQQCADLSHRAVLLGERLAVDGDRPRRRTVEAEDQPHRGGLSGAIRPQEAGHMAGPYRERQIVDGDPVAVSFGQTPYLDHGSR
jgi:hypothetical protein